MTNYPHSIYINYDMYEQAYRYAVNVLVKKRIIETDNFREKALETIVNICNKLTHKETIRLTKNLSVCDPKFVETLETLALTISIFRKSKQITLPEHQRVIADLMCPTWEERSLMMAPISNLNIEDLEPYRHEILTRDVPKIY